MKLTNKRGFTLAEVLITLGVLGIVAAISLPMLINNYKKSVYTTQLRKDYSEMSNVFKNILRETGGNDLIQADFCSGGNNASAAQFFKENYKIVKDCGTSTSNCFAPYNEYRSYKSNNKRSIAIPGYAITMVNGAAVSIYCYSRSGNDLENPMASIYIDTNGKKGPNIVGRDFFRMYVYPDGIIDGYSVTQNMRTGKQHIIYSGYNMVDMRNYNFTYDCHNPNDGDGCIDKLINDNWKMNY